MSNVIQHPATRKADGPRVSAVHDPSGAIVVRIEAVSSAAPDELVALGDCGLEERAWKALVKSGELPARKIGRAWFTTRSALCALVTSAPKKIAKAPVDSPEAAYQAIATGAER